jgi:hypothetical protein
VAREETAADGDDLLSCFGDDTGEGTVFVDDLVEEDDYGLFRDEEAGEVSKLKRRRRRRRGRQGREIERKEGRKSE